MYLPKVCTWVLLVYCTYDSSIKISQAGYVTTESVQAIPLISENYVHPTNTVVIHVLIGIYHCLFLNSPLIKSIFESYLSPTTILSTNNAR